MICLILLQIHKSLLKLLSAESVSDVESKHIDFNNGTDMMEEFNSYFDPVMKSCSLNAKPDTHSIH